MKISKLICPYCNETLVSKTGTIESRAGSPFQRCPNCGKEFVNTHRYEPALYPFEKYIPTKGDLFFDKAGSILIGSGIIVIITLIGAIFGGVSWDLPGIFLIGALVLSSPFVIIGLNDMSKGVTSEMYQKIVDDYLSSLTRLLIKDYAMKLKAHGFEVPDRYFRDNPQTILDYSVREMVAYDKQMLSNYIELHKDHFPELSNLLEQALNRCNTTQPEERYYSQNAPLQGQYDPRIAAKPSCEDQIKDNGNHMESANIRLFCRKCGKELMPDSEFCSYCGTKIIRIKIASYDNEKIQYCRKCGKKLLPDSVYCDCCGTKVVNLQPNILVPNAQETKQMERATAAINTCRGEDESKGVIAVNPTPGDKEDTEVCPLCGEVQRAGRQRCWKCGVQFTHTNE